MEIKCKLCGKVEGSSTWIDSTKKELEEKGLCFECNLWLEHESNYDEGVVIIKDSMGNLNRYSFDPNKTLKPKRGFLGCAGKLQYIHFTDGRKEDLVLTNDLWHQGIIPKRFENLKGFQENAEFISEEKFNKLKMKDNERV